MVLILSRRAAERIYLGDDIVLTIVAVGADKVRIGVKAPAGVRILRNELDIAQTDERGIADIDEEYPSTLPFEPISGPSTIDVVVNQVTDTDVSEPSQQSICMTNSETPNERSSGLVGFIRNRKAA